MNNNKEIIQMIEHDLKKYFKNCRFTIDYIEWGDYYCIYVKHIPSHFYTVVKYSNDEILFISTQNIAIRIEREFMNMFKSSLVV